MPRLLLTLSLACAAVGGWALPASALTKDQVFGIGDVKDPAAFQDPRLKRLRPTSARRVVDWDVARTPGVARDGLDAWYQAVLDAGLEPLVTLQAFEASRTPTVAEYEAAFGAALERWPRIREWQAWNEANHIGEPATYRRPARAAAYAKAMERLCPTCTVVPLTYVLSESVRSRRWLRKFLKAYGRTPRIWAVHAYGDPNHFTFRLLASFLRAHPRGRVWITETAGLASFQDKLAYNLRRQRKATRFAFREAVRFRSRVDRMYYWGWHGASPRGNFGWDSGLLSPSGSPRPAYYAALRYRFKRR